MKKVQQGFTLIELMIVVAIIGILAAIAIPQYQDYTARSQVTRAVGELAAYKTAIEEALMRGDTSITNSELGYTTSTLVSTPVTDPVVFTGGVGSLQVVLGNSASTAVAGATITLSRTAAGNWTCTISTRPTAYKDSYTPTGCSNS